MNKMTFVQEPEPTMLLDKNDEEFVRFLENPVSMPTETPLEEERAIMTNSGVKLEEKLWVDECYLFQDESLAPIFCKSKLIPMKTITTQKLEKMQKEQMEKLQNAQEKPTDADDTIVEEDETEHEANTPSTSQQKEADVWTADD